MSAKRPFPDYPPIQSEYWTGGGAGELRAQRCERCHHVIHPPTVLCPWDHHPELRWEALSGRGQVETWTESRYSWFAGVEAPYLLALVALDRSGHGVGIGRYEGTVGDDIAEVAVAVSRTWRRVGLGSALFMLLTQAALARGINRFRTLCLVDNEDVIGLLRASNLPYRTSVSKGVVETQLELLRSPQPSA